MFPFFVKNDILNKCVFSEIRTVPFLLKEFLNKHIFDLFFFIHFFGCQKQRYVYRSHIHFNAFPECEKRNNLQQVQKFDAKQAKAYPSENLTRAKSPKLLILSAVSKSSHYVRVVSVGTVPA